VNDLGSMMPLSSSPVSKMTIDFGASGFTLDADMIDLSHAGRTGEDLPFGTAAAGVHVDLSDLDNQTVDYLYSTPEIPLLGKLHFANTAQHELLLKNANSAIGTVNDDWLKAAGASSEAGRESEGYSALYGGQGDDTLAAAGHETHMFGGSGADEFEAGANTWIEDGEAGAGDSVSYGGIRLYGGVKQWWMEGNLAYWSPFSSLTAAFPVIGSELIYTASIFVDQATMKFARYRLDADGTLEANLGWGQGGSAAIKNYSLDMNSGVGTAGVTVFQAGGRDSSFNRAHFEQYLNLALKAGFGVGLGGKDPLVLDLNGDGYNLVAEDVSSVHFEFDSDGFGEHTGWVRGTDGFLVRDANSNGVIDNVGEMFGNQSTGGFDMLAGYDSNLDGVINASDAVFASLKVWQDYDQDGITDAGELKTLSQLGIVSISLSNTAPASPTAVGGNTIAHEGHFTRADGSTGNIADVTLTLNESNSKWLGDNTVSTAAAALPELTGFGEVKNLRVCLATTLMTLKVVGTPRQITVTEVKHVPADLINYVIPYIVSFMGLDYGSPSKLLGFAVLFLWIFWITYRSGQIAMNPVLIVFGWRLFELKYSYMRSSDPRVGRALGRTEVHPNRTYYQGSLQDVMILREMEQGETDG